MIRLRSILALFASLVWAAAPAAAQPTSSLAGAPFPRSTFAPSSYVTARGTHVEPVQTQYPSTAAAGGQVVSVAMGGETTRTMSLPKGKSAVIDLPTEASDVMISDPTVADVFLTTPRRINVRGVGSGQTDATFMDRLGRRILKLEIRVDQDTSAAAETISRLLPGSNVQVQAANSNIILSGSVATPAEADRAVRLAASFVPDATHVINMIDVTGGEQVRLEVKVVEVNRTVIKQLGFDLSAIIGQLGGPQYTFAKTATYGVAGALLGGLSGGYSYDSTQQPQSNPVVCPTPSTCVAQPQIVTDRNYKLSTIQQNSLGTRGVNQAASTIQAFERVGLVRTLAEPSLMAISGESGKFLAGGEFPVPTSQDNNGRVSIDFKPYGVGLGYTPVVLSSGRISLKLSVEVSELSSVGAFTLSSGSSSSTTGPSLTVPGLTVRRAETTVELPSGGAFVIAGLLQNQTKETLDSLPGLMQLPILGSLFRSRDFQNNETELVMIVTPYLVKPVRPDQIVTPADGLKIASDIETNLLGRLNTGFGKKAAATAGQHYQGPFGYVVD